MCNIMMEAIQNDVLQELIFSTKGTYIKTRFPSVSVDLHFCVYHSAVIIQDWIHICLAACHGKGIFLYDEASQDQLPIVYKH